MKRALNCTGIQIVQSPIWACDSEGLHRAILNVGSNAIDACRKSERPKTASDSAETVSKDSVTIKVIHDASIGQMAVEVTDTGSGIEPENIEKIFSAFESGKGSRGTGLGLPVSRKIMREHGGDIRVSSVVGKGSCFLLWLPVRTIDDFAVEKTDRRRTVCGGRIPRPTNCRS